MFEPDKPNQHYYNLYKSLDLAIKLKENARNSKLKIEVTDENVFLICVYDEKTESFLASNEFCEQHPGGANGTIIFVVDVKLSNNEIIEFFKYIRLLCGLILFSMMAFIGTKYSAG